MRPLPQKDDRRHDHAPATATTIRTVPKSTPVESAPCGAVCVAGPWPPGGRRSIPTRWGCAFFTFVVFAVGVYVVVRLVSG